LSTPAGQPYSASSWKQEVSLRVAAHRSRGGLPAARPATFVQSRQEPLRRAAQIAARVAARYAQAPSYSQMHVQALAAQNAVPEALPGPLAASAGAFLRQFDAVQAVEPGQPSIQAWEPALVSAQPAVPPSLEAWESEDFRSIREPDFALSPPQLAPRRASRQTKNYMSPDEDGRERPALAEGLSVVEDHEATEPVLFTHAKLIEFPRELVAPRKRRPRRAEGPLAAEGLERQLSIFEVDPGAFPMQPGTDGVAPAWASIELEAQPPDEPEPEPLSAAVLLPDLRMAPIHLRMMSALVDGALIAGALLGAALVAAAGIGHPLPAGIAKISAILGFLLAGLLYQTIFLILDNATPGMRCTGLFLFTFDGQSPTRSRRRTRFGALLLSVLPVGLGVAWMLFDDGHLCWHDRLSKTYLRKG